MTYHNVMCYSLIIVQRRIMARALRPFVLALGLVAGGRDSRGICFVISVSSKFVALLQDPSFSFAGLGVLPFAGTLP